MKKILSTALMFIILSTAIVDTINAARPTDSATSTAVRARRGVQKRRPAARRGRGRGARSLRNNSKQVQVVLETAKKTDNPVVKAEAMKTANELAKELLMDLQDRTWAGDILGKYTPEQVAAAGAKYTNLEIQRTQLVRDIEAKQAELDGMSTKSMVFWTKAEGGKEEAHKVASQELADMKATLKNVNKAMRDQAVIAGKEYCSAIRMAIGALTAVTLAGGAYGIDKYKYEGAGMKAIGKKYGEVRAGMAMEEGEGYGAYGKRMGGAAYGAVTGTLSNIVDSIGNKSAALKKWTSDNIAYYWGSKADAPKEVQKAVTEATNAQNVADKKQEVADQKPNDSKAQDAADKAQEIADSKAAAAEVVVAEEAQKQEDKGETPVGEVAVE